MLVCRVFGVPEEGSSTSYHWSCPNGACDISTGTGDPPRSRIVSGNTLTVNVVSKSDSGEYRCTVSEGGNTKTSSYKVTVAGECCANISLLIDQSQILMYLYMHAMYKYNIIIYSGVVYTHYNYFANP